MAGEKKQAGAEWSGTSEYETNENERLNKKYSAFRVVRWSPISGRFIQVGRLHKTIQQALAASFRLDAKHRSPLLHTIDIAALTSPEAR